MLRTVDILVNSFAQERLAVSQLIYWFDSLSADNQRETVICTRNFLEQSHPDLNTIKIGLEQIPLKPTMTPVVLLKTQPFKIALNKIVDLPDTEIKKAFISLVTIFKVSDKKRRKNFCEGKCEHDWHNLHILNLELTEEYLDTSNGRIN